MSTGDQNGLFTKTQREYLLGKKDDISDGYENSLKSKIRNRVNSLFPDLMLLRNLDKRERELIFESNIERTPRGDVVEWPTVEEAAGEGKFGIWSAYMEFTKFYHKMWQENGGSRENVCADIARALEEAEEEHLNHEYEVDVTVEIETVKQVDIENAMERFDEDGIKGVSGVELKALAEAGEITLNGYE